MTIDKSSLNSFRELYDEHNSYVRHSLHWMVRRDLVDDLVQEVFIKIWKGYDKFKNESSQKTWIYRITMNCTIDYMKKEKRHINVDTDSVEEISASHEGEMATEQIIKKALDKLSPKHRVIFVMFYLQGLSIDDVAKSAKISSGTVKSRLFKSREIVTSELKKHGVEL